jgi:threonine/homoserine/homoserine lactone efflux protein
LTPLLFVKYFIIGLTIAAPIGPIGILCMQRSLSHGMRSGFVSGLGAATADATYGLVAAIGMSLISRLIQQAQVLIASIGALFLFYLAISTFQSGVREGQLIRSRQNLWNDYRSTYFLTIMNPITILFFSGLLAGVGFDHLATKLISPGWMVLGIFLGSASWWLILSGITGIIKSRMNHRSIHIINRICGLTLGVYAVLSTLKVVHLINW